MNKESIIELQKIDCNCNDCVFMVRDMEKFKESLDRHHKWQWDYFNVLKDNLIKKAKWWKEQKNDLDKCNNLLAEAAKMKFQFDKGEVSINYGRCSKLNKDVSFIPNVLQIETQECFKHRKDSLQ